jgi:crotonobetainyl-CoA:carnitine CoA-transferase CaiB-like acyl-CoA transferase
MDANVVLWVGQILLALAFVVDSYIHTIGFDASSARPGMTWLADVGRERMRIIGALEGLGAVGLILPAATGILPWLTPVAATCLAILMAIAAVYHLRRSGEGQNIALNVILGVVAALVAYGRIVVAPF